MNLTSLFPPTILARVLDDLGAIADAARRLPELEHAVLQRVDRMEGELKATRAAVQGLQAQMAPIQELPAVRQAVEPLPGKLDRLEATVKPIAEIKLVRAGIEPLDEDMRAVRTSVDDLEPLMREVIGQLEKLRADLGPLGELAEKIPGVG